MTLPPGAGLGAAKARALKLAQPLSSHLELTYQCNWRCVFCYNPRRHDERRLDGAEWETVLDDLRALGGLFVTLTGGEPTTHPDFLRVLAAARRRAFAVTLFTNGSLLTRELVSELSRLGPLSVELSLHGATPDVHDAATGKPGSLDALLAGIELLRGAGLGILLKTPMTRLNEDDVERMADLADGLGIPYRIDPNLTPRDDGDRSPLGYAASTEGVDRLMRLLARRGRVPQTERQDGGANCGLGRMTVAVDPEGNVYPCLQWRSTSLGNVRQTRLRDLWAGSAAREEASEVARRANEELLARGGPVSRFPFCPALAQEADGGPLTLSRRHVEAAEAADRYRGVA